MGTGTDSSDIKDEAKKRSHVMARLFRGSLDILRNKHEALGTALISHIRSFDKTADEAEYAYVESLGFWRMLVELVFQVYIQICLFVGITLVVVLVVFAWPVRFLVEMFAGSWFLQKDKWQYDQTTHVAPSLDPLPETDSDDSKVVRRVVYEEAKVPKK